MTVSVGGTTITFNDSTTQTTAPVNTNANVNSITAGTGISVNSSTGAVTITNTSPSSGGTVTSVATGNGLTGGTITTSGTISLDFYTGTASNYASYPVGTYLIAGSNNNNYSLNAAISPLYVYSSGSTIGVYSITGGTGGGGQATPAGTWRSRGNVFTFNSCSGFAAGSSYLIQRVA